MRSLGFPEIMVIGALFILLFGGSFFKRFATNLGQSAKAVKDLF